MSSPKRRRLKRLERRCDWLEARIAIGESKGCEMSHDVAELSALRWAIEQLTHIQDELRTENRSLRSRIANQRKVIRNLVAYQQRIALSEEELDTLVDAAALGDAGSDCVGEK